MAENVPPPARMPILDSIYARVAMMTKENGYQNDWHEAKSLNNGSSAYTEVAFLNVSFGKEKSSKEAGQGIYHLTAPIYITGFKDYDVSSELQDGDYEVERGESSIIEDLRFAFGLASDDMCNAGVKGWTYFEELDDTKLSGNRVSAEMEFECKWRDKRV